MSEKSNLRKSDLSRRKPQANVASLHCRIMSVEKLILTLIKLRISRMLPIPEDVSSGKPPPSGLIGLKSRELDTYCIFIGSN